MIHHTLTKGPYTVVKDDKRIEWHSEHDVSYVKKN